MNSEDEKFSGVEFVIDVPKPKSTDFDKGVPQANNISKHYNEIQNKVPMNTSIIMSDRTGKPPTVEQLQDIQNRIMGRSANFKNLSKEEKEKIMFDEIQRYHFDNMPPLEKLIKENENQTLQVDSLDKADLVGPNKPHINIKAKNVRIEIASDGKTITFNNQEVLQKYREALANKNKTMTEEQKKAVKANNAQQIHDSREFE